MSFSHMILLPVMDFRQIIQHNGVCSPPYAQHLKQYLENE